jgi:predicted membrane chloride channel (bestrophin family)
VLFYNEYDMAFNLHRQKGSKKQLQHQGFNTRDAFSARKRTGGGFFGILFAMAIFRCWHILLFYAAWTVGITYLYMVKKWHWIVIPKDMLVIFGTVLGLIVSFRGSQSLQRYTEGRKLWTNIILSSRGFSRIVWFQLSDRMPPSQGMSEEEQKARAMMEKKTVINLVEAFAVSVKHYLRGEDGIYYTDLYHLVKFLPAYALPDVNAHATQLSLESFDVAMHGPETPSSATGPGLPLPVTAHQTRGTLAPPSPQPRSPLPSISVQGPSSTLYSPRPGQSPGIPRTPQSARPETHEKLNEEDEIYLIPAYKPPRWAILELFPFSLLKGLRWRSAKNAKGDRAKKIRAKMLNKADSHNIPLEITLYLGSYLAAMQRRKTEDPMSINQLLGQLNALVNALTGLERILTTPIPWSYRVHLWVILCCYCAGLPFQVVKEMKWFTIPGVILVCATFFGFLVAGEEIENPFGYARNDLNLDHFTRNIIRNELQAITSTPPPDPSVWAFSPENNLIFAANEKQERVPPEEWVRRGYPRMQAAMRVI